MHKPSLSQVWKALVTLTALSAATALPAAATSTTWYVMNYGSDAFSPSCGSKPLPCRSISKAIGLAATGDTILVGPGVYGDLDGNGIFDPPPSGDEAAEIGSGCECMIKVNKQLTIVSRDGAEVTTLDAGSLTQSVVHVVAPAADGTLFGKVSKGFTIRGGADSGLLTDSGAHAVKIAGNIASGNSTGFDVSGAGGLANTVKLVDNVAEENDDGFSMDGSFNLVQGNRAVNNGGSGFVVDGGSHTFKQNVAVGNDNGFEFRLSTAGHLSATGGFTTNSAIGNTTAGALVNVTVASSIFIDKSNLFGNGDPANNCGLAVDNQSPSGTSSIGFSGEYWGLATGAGAVNPADNGGAAATLCNTGLGSNAFASVTPPNAAAKEFTFGQKALK